jgi:hypothetical protein
VRRQVVRSVGAGLFGIADSFVPQFEGVHET